MLKRARVRGVPTGVRRHSDELSRPVAALPQPRRNVGGVALPRFAVVDVETSGLRPRRHHLLQIGLVTVEADGSVVDRWSTLVKLRRPWYRVRSPRHVHGIRRRDLRDAPSPADALAELASRLDRGGVHGAQRRVRRRVHRAGRRAVTARHCASSDGCARSTCRAGSIPTAAHPRPRRRLRPLWRCRSTDHHDALADATATAAVLPHLLRDLGISESSQLDELYFPRRRRPSSDVAAHV